MSFVKCTQVVLVGAEDGFVVFCCCQVGLEDERLECGGRTAGGMHGLNDWTNRVVGSCGY